MAMAEKTNSGTQEYGQDNVKPKYPAGEKKADGVQDPKNAPEQEGLKPDAKKYGANKTQELLGEINVLLSKMEMPEGHG